MASYRLAFKQSVGRNLRKIPNSDVQRMLAKLSGCIRGMKYALESKVLDLTPGSVVRSEGKMPSSRPPFEGAPSDRGRPALVLNRGIPWPTEQLYGQFHPPKVRGAEQAHRCVLGLGGT